MTAIPEQVIDAVLRRIESIPSDVWEAGQARRDPLWQALDDIDDIVAEHVVGDIVRRAVGLDGGRGDS